MSKNAFDIEVIPDLSCIDQLPEPEIDSRLKDPVKIEEHRSAARKKQIEKLGLDPLTGRICSFSFHGESRDMFQVIEEVSDSAEIVLITGILENLCIGEPEINEIITWNGMLFDFPYVYKRAMILKIALPHNCPPLRYWTKKYQSDPHCDLMQEMCGWNIQDKKSLDFTSKRLLGRGKTDRDYLTYVDMIKGGQGEVIGLDNLCDAKLTYDLYRVSEPYLF